MSLPEQQTPDERLCDLCNSSKALLYCRADSAKLCLNCDREAHTTNQLFRKHVRSLLCDGCNSAPCSIFCFTDSVVLCQNCDWEFHSDFRAVHDRRPIEGFSGCPSVAELLSFVGLEELGKNKVGSESGSDDDGWMDLLVWETPSVVCLDDLIVINDDFANSGQDLQAMAVPPLPKNRNAACGKHKEEILTQLRKMARTEPDFDGCCLQDLEPKSEFHSQVPVTDDFVDLQPTLSIPSYEITSTEVGDDDIFEFINFEINPSDTDSVPELVPVHLLHETPTDSNNMKLNTQERDSALSRYKEKKKNRRYEKQIRYESRKVRAEARTRIKGRFAKIEH